jgi:starvation-inducible outer membrane lipoprotein
MNAVWVAGTLVACLVLSSCAPYEVFPPETMEGVDKKFDFPQWRTFAERMEERKVQVGGRIVGSRGQGSMLTIVAMELPIVEHPAYGPKDTGKRSGEFAVTFLGRIDASYLQPGNRFIVVGKTSRPQTVAVDDLPRNLPSIRAECLHIWKTGGREIAEFPSYGAGYEPLEEETMCAPAQ